MGISLSGITMTIQLAARNLFRHRRRSLIAVVSVGFGIAALVVAGGMSEWMFLDFREATIESQYSHIQVARPGFQQDGRSDPYRFLLPRDMTVLGSDRIPNLRSVAPRLMLTGLLSRGESTVSFIGEGVDPAHDLKSNRALSILQGEKLEPSEKNEVLLGQGLATLLGAGVGDDVVLLVNTPRGGLNAVEAKVRGIFASVSKAYDDSALLVPLHMARTLLRVEGAHSWRVYLGNTRHTDAVAARLRAQLDPKAFEVRTWEELADFYTRAVALLREQLGVLRGIVIAIILLGIGNTMMMSVLERTGEIGTAMALGVKRRALLSQFVAEGALLGLFGAIVGIALAIMIGGVIGVLQIEMPPPPGLTRGYIARVWITLPILVEALLVAMLTTTLASLYPSWRASRMVIVDAIRFNR
jgi:putative ABC transport system permease protein